MRAHHRGVTLKSAAGENDGIGIEQCDTVTAPSLDAAYPITRRHHQTAHRGVVQKLHPSPLCRRAKFGNDDTAAPDRLNAGRAGTEIIDRRHEFDAVAPQPSDRCGRVVRKRAKIAGIASSTARPQHVVDETGVDPIGSIEPHVRWRPPCIAAGFILARFFHDRNVDGQASALRLLRRRDRCCEPSRPVSDNNQLFGVLRHRRKITAQPRVQLISAPPSI
ncbi:hypothetical protein GALL_545500 [mine drainage metagenome]|uniref:Uncharacterized protein n=1 Tax=mine drainage metagenome TaxID=410659 RepID=A0A1J5NXC9_9ZZZZ